MLAALLPPPLGTPLVTVTSDAGNFFGGRRPAYQQEKERIRAEKGTRERSVLD